MSIAPESTLMFAEAAEAADVIARQRTANRALVGSLAARLRDVPPRAVSTCARGSSDHAATFAKYLIETVIGVPVSSAAPSVASVYHAAARLDDTLLLAISQSGRSPDLLSVVQAGRAGGAYLAAMVNDAASPLADMADSTLPLRAGAEKSVAATKSYIASLAAILGLVAAWAQDEALSVALDEAPALLARSWEVDWSPLVDGLANARGLYVIGRGLGLGVAQEAALKFKETCGLHAEAFSAAEVRHGPMALIGPDFPVLVFRQDDETAAGVDSLVSEALGQGGVVYCAGSAIPGAVTLPTIDASPAIQPMLQIQSFYRAVNALSVRRGFDPDSPPHLRKVTETV
ncbi:SIS domain-containing protein [Sphingomonas sp. QA11]|uniref:SIS domain-containing protein n=1 Tax=Sphingomonas sp. QA11 TaxID=2950605 RepID=UPI00234BC709|nr:SIS domain-containing protein [Sphingomonas sp. QA11]WCM25116.1 SIS domain-containing protein [Sphingomonas sp. QA11]